jgi:hypothetical protein
MTTCTDLQLWPLVQIYCYDLLFRFTVMTSCSDSMLWPLVQIYCYDILFRLTVMTSCSDLLLWPLVQIYCYDLLFRFTVMAGCGHANQQDLFLLITLIKLNFCYGKFWTCQSTRPVPSSLDKKEGRRCQLLLRKRGHLLRAFLSNEPVLFLLTKLIKLTYCYDKLWTYPSCWTFVYARLHLLIGSAIFLQRNKNKEILYASYDIVIAVSKKCYQ